MTYQSYLEELREVIRSAHGADSKHVKTIAVKEVSLDEIVWDGLVEVFELKGHPNRRRVFAWADDTDDPEHPRRHVTVLDSNPIKSAQDAVRAAVAQGFKKPKVGTPKQPKVEAKERIVPVRFKAEEFDAMLGAAKAVNQTVSEWLRNTVQSTLKP